MSRSLKVEIDGTVLEAFPNTIFKVKFDDGREVTAHLSGKMRIHHIKIILGDRVKVEMTPYDKNKGRIIFRYRS